MFINLFPNIYKVVAPPFNQNIIPPTLDESRILISEPPSKETFSVDPINNIFMKAEVMFDSNEKSNYHA
jgi:hypothetical protein